MILVRQMLSTGKVERLYLLTVGTEKVLSATIWCQVRMVATVLSDLKIFYGFQYLCLRNLKLSNLDAPLSIGDICKDAFLSKLKCEVIATI